MLSAVAAVSPCGSLWLSVHELIRPPGLGTRRCRPPAIPASLCRGRWVISLSGLEHSAVDFRAQVFAFFS